MFFTALVICGVFSFSAALAAADTENYARGACVGQAFEAALSYTSAEAQLYFPYENYIQSANPTLTAANNNYAAVYDAEKGSVFCIGGEFKTIAAPTLTAAPDMLTLVGDNLIIGAQNSFYAADISSPTAEFSEIALSSPTGDKYLYSDGEYLYAKTQNGGISVYDSRLNILYDNVYNDSFTGDTVFAASELKAYVFNYRRGLPYLTQYDFQTAAVSETALDTSLDITGASASGNYMLADKIGADGKRELIVLNPADGTVLAHTGVEPLSYSLCGNEAYIIERRGSENRLVRYSVLYDESISLVKDAEISMRGSDGYHLDSPSDICLSGGSLYIADTQNNRIAALDTQTSRFSSINGIDSPVGVCADKAQLYAYSSHSLYAINGGAATPVAETDKDIVDITVSDNFYVVFDDGVYVYFGGKFVRLFTVSGAVALDSDENLLYVLTENAFYILDKNGNRICSSAGDFSGALDLKADARGDILVLYADTLKKFAVNAASLTEIQSAPTRVDGLDSTAVSFAVDGQTAYFVTEECFIGKIAVDYAQAPPDFTAPQITEAAISSLTFATLNAQAAYCFEGAAVASNLRGIDADEVIIVLGGLDASQDAEENLVYALYNSKLVRVAQSAIVSVTPQSADGRLVFIRASALYAYPNAETGSESVEQGASVDGYDDAAGFGGGSWVRVAYNGKIYFALKADLQPYQAPPEENNVRKAKTQTSRVGGTVPIYSLPDESSETLAEVADGKDIEIVSENGAFYCVRYGEIQGYIKKSNATFEAVTKIQAMAIVLSVVILLAGTAVTVVLKRGRTKSDE